MINILLILATKGAPISQVSTPFFSWSSVNTLSHQTSQAKKTYFKYLLKYQLLFLSNCFLVILSINILGLYKMFMLETLINEIKSHKNLLFCFQDMKSKPLNLKKPRASLSSLHAY